MPAAFTPTWSRPAARSPRLHERRRERPRTAHRHLHAGSRVLAQREWRAGAGSSTSACCSAPAARSTTAARRCAASGRCSDGYCFHSLMTGRFGAPANQALSDWMDESGADNPLRGVDWLTLQPLDARSGDPRDNGKPPSKLSFARARGQEIATEGRRRGINATVVAAPADVLADPHLRAREFWESAMRETGARADSCRSVVRTCRDGHAATRIHAPSVSMRRDRWRACACWIFPGRWSVRSPPRPWEIWAARSSRSSRAHDPVCRVSTCRSLPRAPATSTTSPGSRT